MQIKEFLDSMHHLQELSDRVYPDKYKLVCMQEGIKETTAMDMYAYFQSIVKGHIPYRDNRPLSDEQLARIIDLAIKADGMYSENGHRIGTVILFSSPYEDRLKNVLVIWRPKDGGERQYAELDLTCQDTYVTIGRMIDNGNVVEAIIRQADRIDNTSSCMSLKPKERGAHAFNVYDGDVILAYLDRPNFWGSDAHNCGLYVCVKDCYKKLLYTPDKGYVRKGEPDYDDDFTLDVGEDSFNSHVLTMTQKWKRIGNVHVDTGFLIEKQV